MFISKDHLILVFIYWLLFTLQLSAVPTLKSPDVGDDVGCHREQ